MCCTVMVGIDTFLLNHDTVSCYPTNNRGSITLNPYLTFAALTLLLSSSLPDNDLLGALFSTITQVTESWVGR